MSKDPLGISDSDTYWAHSPIPARIFELRGEVQRVKDGDTCIAWFDDGDGRTLEVAVRYEHVNCPECSHLKQEPGGLEATQFNRSIVDRKPILFRTRKRRDENGRMLGDVFVWQGKNVPPLDVTLEIIKAGHGTKR